MEVKLQLLLLAVGVLPKWSKSLIFVIGKDGFEYKIVLLNYGYCCCCCCCYVTSLLLFGHAIGNLKHIRVTLFYFR